MQQSNSLTVIPSVAHQWGRGHPHTYAHICTHTHTHTHFTLGTSCVPTTATLCREEVACLLSKIAKGHFLVEAPQKGEPSTGFKLRTSPVLNLDWFSGGTGHLCKRLRLHFSVWWGNICFSISMTSISKNSRSNSVSIIHWFD